MRKISLIVVVLCLAPLASAFAQDFASFHPGIQAGVGTDLNLGLAVGLKASVMPFDIDVNPLEVGVEVFYSNSTETSDNGVNEYEEQTELIILGVMANYLYNYSLEDPSFFLVAGVGIAGISMWWEERSLTDVSLGIPWKTGSRQEAEGIAAGAVLSVGGGYAFAKGFEIRLEIPVIFIFGPYGEASAIAPALTLMGGYRF